MKTLWTPWQMEHVISAAGKPEGCLIELLGDESFSKEHLHPDGINIGLNLGQTAGAGIENHLHFHVVPRWEGDHNFMTVTGAIHTIPQLIDHTIDTLVQDFQDLLHSRGNI